MRGTEFVWFLAVLWGIVVFYFRPRRFTHWLGFRMRRKYLLIMLGIENGITFILLSFVYFTLAKPLDNAIAFVIVLLLFILGAGKSIYNCAPAPGQPRRANRGQRRRQQP